MNRKDESRLGRTWLAAATLAALAGGVRPSAAAAGAGPGTGGASAGVPAGATIPAGEGPSLAAQAYTDKLSGFSLRPPAGTQRIKEPGSATLVRWISQDANTGAVAWTVGVNVALEKDPNLDLPAVTGALAAYLKDANVLHEVVSTEVIRVDGKGAIDVCGTTGGGEGVPRSWRRQVWVLAQPGRFLVFWVAGPEGARDRLDQVLRAVVATVKIVDPLEVLKAQEANLLRGRQLLAGLRTRPLTPAGKLQWFVFRQDDKVVGWTLQAESIARRGTQSGLEIQTLTLLRLPKDDLRLSRRTLFATATGGEQWRETLQVGEGDKKSLVQEEGLRQEDLVLCTISIDRQLMKRQKSVPFDANEPRDMYLPRALGLVLPRLLDLSQPTAYAFATYSTQDNNFKLRTFTVVGPDRITLAGRPVDAVHLTDVEEADEQAASDLWVDAKGATLRIRAPGWPVIETGTREEIVAKMPEAAKIIEEALRK